MQLHIENQIRRDGNAVCLGILRRKHPVNGGRCNACATIRLDIGYLIGGCAKPAKNPYLAGSILIHLNHQIAAAFVKRQPLLGNAAVKQEPVCTAMAVVNLAAAAISAIHIGVVARAADKQVSA